MTRMMFAFLFVIVGCTETRYELVHDRVTCSSDTECDDGNEVTDDWCETDNGCHHGRVTVVEVPETFDPSDPRRQDAEVLCEEPTNCETGNTVRLWGCTGYAGAEPWSERNYVMSFEIGGTTSEIIHIAPRLWIGDTSDSFRVTVEAGYDRAPVVDREMSVAEIQDGFDIDRRRSDGRLESRISIVFEPIGDVRSRALQWALLPGDVTDSVGMSLSTCLQTGTFMRVPAHGFLTFQEGPAGEPQCAGSVRAVDLDPIVFTESWVREESDPTIRFLYHPMGPGGWVISFDSTREMIDWVRSSYVPYWDDTDHFCARIRVVRDGTLATTHPGRSASFRPGVMLMWFDADGTWHFGVADRNFVIRDTGGMRPVGPGGTYMCGMYGSWTGIILGPCEMALSAEELARFTIVPTDPSTLDPAAMYERVSVYEYFRTFR